MRKLSEWVYKLACAIRVGFFVLFYRQQKTQQKLGFLFIKCNC
ncbi:hypothetical protein X564_15055 [Pseudoalteromonas agarivorans]|nr:hypothetical protein X564_15055 [Pseudoalteromonas agarivorans]